MGTISCSTFQISKMPRAPKYAPKALDDGIKAESCTRWNVRKCSFKSVQSPKDHIKRQAKERGHNRKRGSPTNSPAVRGRAWSTDD